MQSDTATTERASPPVWGIDAIGGKYSPTVVEADGTVVALVPAKPWRTEAEALAITRLQSSSRSPSGRARGWSSRHRRRGTRADSP
jgi:hypothetical protein